MKEIRLFGYFEAYQQQNVDNSNEKPLYLKEIKVYSLWIKCLKGKTKMGKLDVLMEGRLQGMEFALRLVKDQGIEALEKEIRYRSRNKICLNVTTAELNAASNKIKEQTLDTFTILGIAALHDLFGFGEKRCQRFMDKMDEGARYLADDLATWDDYIKDIKEKLGFEVTIRWNN